MFRWLGAALALSLLIALQACAPKSQESCGFVQNVYGERVSWKRDAPVTMRIHESVPDSMVPSIVAAANTWEKTAGRQIIRVVTSPKVAGPPSPQKDGQNVIYLLNSWESNKSSEQGRTSVYWVGDLIKEADIRLNGNDFSFYWNNSTVTRAAIGTSANVNIEALVLHEMGHVLGLMHNDGSGSVMATYLSSNDDRTHLTASDEASLRCEY